MQSLSQDEKTYLEDETIKEDYNEKIDIIWKKVENDKNREIIEKKEIEEKYNDLLYKVVLDHSGEMEKIKNINEEEKKKQQETNKKMEDMVNNFHSKISEIEIKAEEERKKMEEKQKNAEKDFLVIIELLKKEMKEEREEEKRKEKEEKLRKYKEKDEKRKKVNKLFKEKVEKIKEDRILNTEKEFKLFQNNFCMEDISKYDQKKITSFIKNFLKSEKIPNIIINYLINLIDINKSAIKNIEHLNIILVGPSGVGKSTLINAMLELNTQTGFGSPQTQGIEFYSSEKMPFLRLVDSRGIEKNTISDVNATFESIRKFIQSQIEKKEYDKYIHAIWYCWTGTRLEDSEVKILKLLSQQYSLDTLPVIIVYTNAVFEEEIENAKKYIKETLKLDNEFIDVLSLEKKIKINSQETIIKAKNLDLLREKSVELSKLAVKSSIYDGLVEEVKTIIQEKINILTEALKNQINEEVKEYIKKMDENTKIEEFYQKTKYIILNVLYKYFLLNPNENIKIDEKPEIKLGDIEFSFTENSLNILNDFILDYFEIILNIYQDNLENFLTKYSKELSNDLAFSQIQFNTQNDNLLTDLLTNIDFDLILKKDFKDKLDKPAQLAALKNAFIFIVEPLISKIGEYFTELYKQGMKKKSFMEKATEAVKISFDNIEKKIKQYNESLNIKNNNNENNQEPAPNNSVTDDVDDLYEDINA